MKKSRLITTDSYFNVFPILIKELEGKTNGLSGKNLIFCEEKISLMTERIICSAFKGSFNTEVFSFGNYLRNRKSEKKVLSKEGSAMVIKKLLSTIDLSFFPARKTNLAPSLYDLIIQLKSAGVKPAELCEASKKAEGLLQNKLVDMYKVYSAYEEYISSNSFDDQSSLQDYIPPIILEDGEMSQADVYLIGYVGWTSQTREIIKALLHTARSVTVILTEGNNEQVFVNETPDDYTEICRRLGVKVEKTFIQSDYAVEGKKIIGSLYNPQAMTGKPQFTDKIYLHVAQSIDREAEHIAQVIRAGVIEGKMRFQYCTVAIPDPQYKNALEKAFKALEVPFFFDEKKKPNASPLVGLITSYLDVFRKNMERKSLCSFFKNPLVSNDKEFNDRFENYLLKFNVNYSYFKNPFVYTYDGKDSQNSIKELQEFNAFREYICSLVDTFDIRQLLTKLDVESKLSTLSEQLKAFGEIEESAINDQIFGAVNGIMDEIDLILGKGVSYKDYKTLFLSGINALELSIIPQFNDAVFVGEYRECALAKADYLFVVGLTEGVPNYKDDVALLTDADINKLSTLKVLVEPKIKVVNKRIRENFTMSMGAFNKRLFLSYPLVNADGSSNKPSECMLYLGGIYNANTENFKQEYLTQTQGYNTFAVDVGRFAEGENLNLDKATSFYNLLKGENTVNSILTEANKQVATRLVNKNLKLGTMSPTQIETFYSCPYKCFASRIIGVNERDTGETKATSIGTFFHEIFAEYVLRLDKITDRESSDREYEEVKNKLISDKKYSGFFAQADSKFSADYAIDEAREYCYKMFLDFKNSYFRPLVSGDKTEVGFGDGKRYPAIELLGGKAKIKGSIDRVDVWGDYCRIIDYKTGEADASVKELFKGKKLQLYLYALAVNDKKLAGSYYLPISNSYRPSGKASEEDKDKLAIGVTLNDKEVVCAQDLRFKDSGKSEFLRIKQNKKGIGNTLPAEYLDCFKEYALAISNTATKEMSEGFIAPSPVDNACDFCPYGGMCGDVRLERKVDKADKSTIVEAMGGSQDDSIIDEE